MVMEGLKYLYALLIPIHLQQEEELRVVQDLSNIFKTTTTYTKKAESKDSAFFV